MPKRALAMQSPEEEQNLYQELNVDFASYDNDKRASKDTLYNVLEQHANTGAAVKTSLTTEGILEIVNAVVQGRIKISYNRDLTINLRIVKEITGKSMQTISPLSQEMQEPIVLVEHGDNWDLTGGQHRVVAFVSVCLGFNAYTNKNGRVVRSCPHIFESDEIREFYENLLSMKEGFVETLQHINDTAQTCKNNYHTFLKIMTQHGLVESCFFQDGTLIPVENHMAVQMTLSKIKFPVLRISYKSKRIKTDNDKLVSRVSSCGAFHDGRSKDHSFTDLIQILFFNGQVNSKLHEVLSDQFANSFEPTALSLPTGTFSIDTRRPIAFLLMSISVLTRLINDNGDTTTDMIPKQFVVSKDPLKEKWLKDLWVNVNNKLYVEAAEYVSEHWKNVFDQFVKMYYKRNGRKQSVFCQLVKQEIAKREKNRIGFIYAIMVCLVSLGHLSSNDINSFLMCNVVVKDDEPTLNKTQLMIKRIFSCMNPRLKSVGEYNTPHQFETVVRHCISLVTQWKEGHFDENDDEENDDTNSEKSDDTNSEKSDEQLNMVSAFASTESSPTVSCEMKDSESDSDDDEKDQKMDGESTESEIYDTIESDTLQNMM